MAKPFGSLSFASSPGAVTFRGVSSRSTAVSLVAVGWSKTRTVTAAGTLSVVTSVVSIWVFFAKAIAEFVLNPAVTPVALNTKSRLVAPGTAKLSDQVKVCPLKEGEAVATPLKVELLVTYERPEGSVSETTSRVTSLVLELVKRRVYVTISLV